MKITKIKNKINTKIANKFFTYDTKIINKLSIYFFKINSFIIIKFSRINNEFNDKLNKKVNVKFSRINNKLIKKLIKKITTINLYNTNYTFTMQKILNNIIIRINSIEKAYHNKFDRILFNFNIFI